MVDVVVNSDPNQAPEFVVDGTKIPDVDVCRERNEGGTKRLQTYSLMSASPMLGWSQYRPPPTRLGSSSFGIPNLGKMSYTVTILTTNI